VYKSSTNFSAAHTLDRARSFFFDGFALLSVSNLLQGIGKNRTTTGQLVLRREAEDLLKQVRTHLVETARPVMEAIVQEVTGVKILNLHHDISTIRRSRSLHPCRAAFFPRNKEKIGPSDLSTTVAFKRIGSQFPGRDWGQFRSGILPGMVGGAYSGWSPAGTGRRIEKASKGAMRFDFGLCLWRLANPFWESGRTHRVRTMLTAGL
jgi:hypothetical protein